MSSWIHRTLVASSSRDTRDNLSMEVYVWVRWEGPGVVWRGQPLEGPSVVWRGQPLEGPVLSGEGSLWKEQCCLERAAFGRSSVVWRGQPLEGPVIAGEGSLWKGSLLPPPPVLPCSTPETLQKLGVKVLSQLSRRRLTWQMNIDERWPPLFQLFDHRALLTHVPSNSIFVVAPNAASIAPVHPEVGQTWRTLRWVPRMRKLNTLWSALHSWWRIFEFHESCRWDGSSLWHWTFLTACVHTGEYKLTDWFEVWLPQSVSQSDSQPAKTIQLLN